MDKGWSCSSLGRGVRAASGEAFVLLKSCVTQAFYAQAHRRSGTDFVGVPEMQVPPILIMSIVSVIIGATCVVEEWG